jgi:hypothetical protein
MKNNKDWLYRSSIPRKYDLAPLGTICCVFIDKISFEIFCQISKDEDHPQWTLIGQYELGLPDEYINTEIERVMNLEHNIKSINKVEQKRLNFKGLYKNEHRKNSTPKK